MKKIINHPDSVVSETLMGLVSADNTLEYLPGVEIVTKKVRSGNVGIVSGGGSGHEPAHAGIGNNPDMLSDVVSCWKN